MYKLHKETLFAAFGVFLILCFLVPEYCHFYDMSCWANWIGTIKEKGLGHCYESDINYLPGHLYIFRFILFFQSPEYIKTHLYFLKYFTIPFDVAGAVLVASLVRDKWVQIVLLLITGFNVASLHNSMLWGQLDVVFSVFIFASLIAAVRKKFLFAWLLYIIALNFKFQSIIIFPLLTIYSVYNITSIKDFKGVLKGLVVVVALQVLILLPWIASDSLKQIARVLKELSGNYTYASLNASNIWYLLLPGNIRWVGDDNTWMGLEYKKLGLIMAGLSLFISLLPLIIQVLKKWMGRESAITTETLFGAGVLSVMCFFFFNTQMHERYTFPAFLLVAAYCVYTGYWWNYLLFSIAYFLNNEAALRFFHLKHNASYFDFSFSAKIYLILMVSMVISFYLRLNHKKTPSEAQSEYF
ncbi:MAG: hypothetical protein U0X76_09685 [Bacteroidia bacterium]